MSAILSAVSSGVNYSTVMFAMSSLSCKFEDDLVELEDAVYRGTDLRKNRTLYKKICKFYKKEGVIFTGDAAMDYNMVISYLSEDLIEY